MHIKSVVVESDRGAFVEGRDPNAIYFDEPTLTVQASKEETDINLIIARAVKGADILHVNDRVGRYGDFSNVPSYQEALDLVKRAQGMFADLPANVRERFANDAARMVSFLQDPANYDEAVKLGLVIAKPKAEDVPPVDPAASNGAVAKSPGAV